MKELTARRALGVLSKWMKSIGVSDRSTILLHPFCCLELLTLVESFGASVEYLDITEDSLCIDLDSLGRDCIENVDLLINIRTLGYSGDFNNSFRRLKSINPALMIVDDRCLCWPELIDEINQKDEIADLILYSTGYSKYVDFGFGGYGFTKNDLLFSEEPDFGSKNSKTSWVDDRALNHAFYFEKVRYERVLSKAHKERVNQVYLEELSHLSTLNSHLDWRFNLRLRNSRKIRDLIFSENLFCSSHYKNSKYMKLGLKNCENLQNSIVNLFNDFRVTVNDAKKIAEIIKNAES